MPLARAILRLGLQRRGEDVSITVSGNFSNAHLEFSKPTRPESSASNVLSCMSSSVNWMELGSISLRASLAMDKADATAASTKCVTRVITS